MQNSNAEISYLNRSEAPQKRVIPYYENAFMSDIVTQAHQLDGHWEEIAQTDAPELIVQQYITREPLEKTYERLYISTSKMGAEWIRSELGQSKSYADHFSRKQMSAEAEEFGVSATAVGSASSIDILLWQQVSMYLRSQGGVNITSITQTSQKEALKYIRQILQEGVENGWNSRKTGRELARRVPLEMRKATFRGQLIARTEVGNAYAMGTYNQVLDLDINVKRYWLATMDGRERVTHANAYLETRNNPIGIKDFYDVGGIAMQRPHDPSGGAENVCNCRCVDRWIRG